MTSRVLLPPPIERGPVATHRLGGPAVVGLATLGVAIAFAAEWLLYRDLVRNEPNAGLHVLTDAIVGLSYVAMGLVTWVRRPDSRIGPLLYLTGCVSFIGNLAATDVVGLHHAGIALTGLWYVVLGVVVLSYPTGRLPGRAERRFLLAATTWVVVSGAAIVSQLDPSRCPPGTCPPNPFRIDLGVDLLPWFQAIQTTGGVVVWASFAALVMMRWRDASGPARRSLRPLWLAAILLAVGRVGDGLVTALLGPTVADAYVTWVGIPLAVGVPIALAYGLVRGRLEQASVGDLVITLGEGPPDAGLAASIGRALGDPGASLAFPTAEGGLVDVHGRPVAPPAGDQRVTPIGGPGGPIAVLIHDASLDANPALVRSVGAATRLALENARLTAEVRAQLVEVRASRSRIVAASDAERARIERNLHDGAQQRLVAVTLHLRSLAERTSDPTQAAAIASTADELDEALAELRDLARGIHPTAVAQGGLAGAVEGLADRSPVPVRIAIPPTRWPSVIEVAAYFVIAEALTNAIRHAHARHIAIEVAEMDRMLVVSVVDDGVGGAIPGSQHGLGGLRDRVAALGGTLAVDSPAVGGTTVRASFPLDAA